MADSIKSVGILGAGYISDWHAKALQSIRGLVVAAVADPAGSHAEDFARRHKVANSFKSLAAMLDGCELDAVHVLTPPATHADLIEQILKSGVDAFVEKPFCTSRQQADRLVELARSTGRRLGVAHNFLYARPYMRLKRDMEAGLLGRVEWVDIVWAKPLPQFSLGTLREWMFSAPGNLMFEIGPHSAAHLLDLLGAPDSTEWTTSGPALSADGVTCFRNWDIRALRGETEARLRFSYRPGRAEHYIRVRGSAASAVADIQAGVYLRSGSSRFAAELGQLSMSLGEAASLSRQAVGTCLRTVLGKVRLLPESSPYGESIRLAIEAFYPPSDGQLPYAISAEMGRDVIALCEEIAEGVNQASPVAPKEQDRPDAGGPVSPECLVIGGTGFIGKAIVRRLAEQGRSVRVMTRSAKGVPRELRHPNVAIFEGDYASERDIDRALEGVQTVIHLAKSNSRLWEEYVERDLEPTKLLAEKCLERGIRRLVYAGTIASLYTGRKAGTIDESTPVDPKLDRRLHYGRVKGMCEHVLMDVWKTSGLPVTILRPGVVLGEGGMPLHWGIGMWQGENTCLVWGKGDHPQPIVLVDDCADAFVAALDAEGVEGRAFNIVGPPLLSARDYLREMERHGKTKLTIHETPIWRFFAADCCKWLVKMAVRHPDRKPPSYRDWESRTNRAVFDCSSAEQALHWKPESRREEVIRRGIHVPVDEFLG